MTQQDTINGQRIIISLGEVEGVPIAFRKPLAGPSRPPTATTRTAAPAVEVLARIPAARATAAEIQAARAAVRQAQEPKHAAKRRGVEAAQPLTAAVRRRTQRMVDLILARLTEGTADPAVALARVEAIAPALPVELYDSAVDAISAAAVVMGKDLRLRPSWLARVRGNSDGLDAATRRSRRQQERVHQRTRALGAQFESNDASRPRVNHLWRTTHTAQPVTELRPVLAVASGPGAWEPCRDMACTRTHTTVEVEVEVAAFDAPTTTVCGCTVAGIADDDCRDCRGTGVLGVVDQWESVWVERRGCVRPPVVEDAARVFAVRHANPRRYPAGIASEVPGIKGSGKAGVVRWIPAFGDRREGNRANAWPAAALIGPDSPWRVPSIPAHSPLRAEAAAWRARAHDERMKAEQIARDYRSRAGSRANASAQEVPWVEHSISVEDSSLIAAQDAVVSGEGRYTWAGIQEEKAANAAADLATALAALTAAVEAVEAEVQAARHAAFTGHTTDIEVLASRLAWGQRHGMSVEGMAAGALADGADPDVIAAAVEAATMVEVE